jgi:proton-translocating NADH-quinone oxidoreductase chain L
MPTNTTLAFAALFLPLFSCLAIVLLSFARLSRFAHLPAIISFAAAAVCSIMLLVNMYGSSNPVLLTDSYTWFEFSKPPVDATQMNIHLSVKFGLSIDPLSTIMLATVTFISTWIALFSGSYMYGDGGFARYFAIMSLFVFSMCLLVLANNLLLLLAGWEGVGLCSYLLVGYYYFKPSAAAAARKAFLVTRLGDAFFLFGIFLLWRAGGYNLEFHKIYDYLSKNPPHAGLMLSTSLLLFCGAVGKSAQFPLYVWLPDAMEGPTPVSALIHAATMVTAGVFLLARCAPVFMLSASAQAIVTATGAITAFIAAFIALAQTDLKRVLAYSTVSQLGFMFMALGCSGAITPALAVTAAMFHLFTHAFFKALLFLGSGSVMHAMGNVIDMRKFGGLRKIMPVTHITFLIGSLALAGIPPLAGFWSKDQILDSLSESRALARDKYAFVYTAAFFVALLTAGMTAFYTFRAYFLTFWGPEKIPHEAHGHAHESPRAMTYPLIVLAVGAIFAGLLVEPFNHGLSKYLSKSTSLKVANQFYAKNSNRNVVDHPHIDWSLAATGTACGLIGLGIAFALYRNGARPTPESLEPIKQLSQNKLYVDEIYGVAAVKPAEIAATASKQLDNLIGMVGELVANVPVLLGSIVRRMQNGMVQNYALSAILGLTIFIAFILYLGQR